jgi:hypothetical protein
MFKLCGADLSEFVLNGESLKSGGRKDPKGKEKPKNSDNVFEYELWGEAYTANKLVDMLHDVFDLIAEKYPEKLVNIAQKDEIKSVALKSELEQKTTCAAKIKQFENFRYKEHVVDGEIYCVNAGFCRKACIEQIEMMLNECGVNSSDFNIIKAPEIASHKGSESDKPDFSEILNEE